MKKMLRAVCGALVASTAVQADSIWLGGSDSWGNPAKWSNGVPDKNIKGTFEAAVFEKTGEQTVTLDGDRAVLTFRVDATATDGVTLLGGGTDSELHMGDHALWSHGIFVDKGAGPVVIGSREPGQAVNVRVFPYKTWENRSEHPVTVYNALSGGTDMINYSPWPGIWMMGKYRFSGPNTFVGTIHLGHYLGVPAHVVADHADVFTQNKAVY